MSLKKSPSPVSRHNAQFPNVLSEFLHYVKEGNLRSLRNLLSKGDVDVNNVQDTDGSSALHLACAEGDLTVIIMLIEYGARLSSFNAQGWAPIHSAVVKGDLSIVSWLVEKEEGAVLNSRTLSEGYSLLHLSAIHGNLPLVIWLHNNQHMKPDELVDKSGCTPLFHSIRCKHYLVSKHLLEAHRDSTKVNIFNADGDTLLHVAVCADALEECKLLADHLADFGLKNKAAQTPLQLMSGALKKKLLLQHEFTEAALTANCCSLWFEILQVDDLPGLERAVLAYTNKYPALARVVNRDGREAYRLASKKGNKAALMTILFTLGRYELDRGPLYRSQNTVLVSAVDHLAGDVSYNATFCRIIADQDSEDERKGPEKQMKNRHNERCLSAQAFCRALRAAGAVADDHDDVLINEFSGASKEHNDMMTGAEFVRYCIARWGESRAVVIKFVRRSEQLVSEHKNREANPFDPRFVLGALDGPSSAQWQTAVDSLVVGGRALSDYPYALVLPAGDRSLDVVVRLEHPDLPAVCVMAAKMARALQHLHDLGVVHGDFKLANVIRLANNLSSGSDNGDNCSGSGHGACVHKLVLVDLEALVPIDEPLGAGPCRFSSALLPPEMFVALKNEEARRTHHAHWAHLHAPANDAERITYDDLWDKIRPFNAPRRTTEKPTAAYVVRSFVADNKKPLPYKTITARPAHDIWAFGAALFHLITGVPLLPWGVTRDDTLCEDEAAATIATWTDGAVGATITSHVNDAVAANLLRKLLRVKPGDRFQSLSDVLEHPFFDPIREPNEAAIVDAAAKEDARNERDQEVADIQAEEKQLVEHWRAMQAEVAATEARRIALDRHTVHMSSVDSATLLQWKRTGTFLAPGIAGGKVKAKKNEKQASSSPSSSKGKAHHGHGHGHDDAEGTGSTDSTGAAAGHPLVVPTSVIVLPYALDERSRPVAIGAAGPSGVSAQGSFVDSERGSSGAVNAGTNEGEADTGFAWLDKLATLSAEVAAAVDAKEALAVDALDTFLSDLRHVHLFLLDDHTLTSCHTDPMGGVLLYEPLVMTHLASRIFVLRLLPHMMMVLKAIFLQSGPEGVAQALGLGADPAPPNAVQLRVRTIAGRLDSVESAAGYAVLTRAVEKHIEVMVAAAAAKAKRQKSTKGRESEDLFEAPAVLTGSHGGAALLFALEWFLDRHDPQYELRGLHRVQLAPTASIHLGRALWVSDKTLTKLSQLTAQEEGAYLLSLSTLWIPKDPEPTELEQLQRENDELRKQVHDLIDPAPDLREIQRKKKANVFMRVRRMMGRVVPGFEDPGDPLVIADLQMAQDAVLPDFLQSSLQLSQYGRQRKAIHAATSAAATVASGYSNHIIDELRREKEAWLLSKEMERHELAKRMEEQIKMLVDDKERWLDMKDREKQGIISQMQAQLRQVLDDRDAMLSQKSNEISNLSFQMEQHMQSMAADKHTLIEQKDKERDALIVQFENQLTREREAHHAREMQSDRENFMLHQQIDFLQLIVADKDADNSRNQRRGVATGSPESTDSFTNYLRKAYGTNRGGTSKRRSPSARRNRRSRPTSPSDSMLVETESYSLVHGSVETATAVERESSADERLRSAYLMLGDGGGHHDGKSTAAVLRGATSAGAGAGAADSDEQLQQHLISAFKSQRGKVGGARPRTASSAVKSSR